MPSVPFVVLIILDGWGLAPSSPGNAIAQAETPNMDSLWASFPHTQLAASGEAVGLPRGESGNTETGHLNLGAGRIVYQDLMRINTAVAGGSFFSNEAFLEAINHAKENNSNLHLMGLVGSGGVHSSTQHLYALIRLCKEQDFRRVFVHMFSDGRDSPPNAAISYIAQLEDFLKQEGVGQIASIIGRYWAMDRDFRWDRTEVAYRALTEGVGRFSINAQQAVNESYEKGITDEFIQPILIGKDKNSLGLVRENDSAIFFNFRIDRPRQLTKAFVLENFKEEAQTKLDFDPYTVEYQKKHTVKTPGREPFQRGPKLKNLFFVTMTEYGSLLNPYVSVAFPREVIPLPLGAVLSEQGLRQLRLAESEKERFVTLYFNGQREKAFAGEVREILPSLTVATYDQAPEMSAEGISEACLKVLRNNSASYSFILINFANPDMVGHTGNLEAAKKACSIVDACVGQIVERVNIQDGITLITGDHGNAEEMLTSDGKVHTEHTTNPVPFIAVGRQFMNNPQTLQSGILGDVAPTVLRLLNIPSPREMTGRPLL